MKVHHLTNHLIVNLGNDLKKKLTVYFDLILKQKMSVFNLKVFW